MDISSNTNHCLTAETVTQQYPHLPPCSPRSASVPPAPQHYNQIGGYAAQVIVHIHNPHHLAGDHAVQQLGTHDRPDGGSAADGS